MIHTNPGDIFTADGIGFADGLVGTIGVSVLNTSGGVVVARTTSGIVEDPTGDYGDPKYTATLTAPVDADDYRIRFDANGLEAYEDLVVDFTSTVDGAAFATTADFEARLGITLTDAETIRAAALLAQATGLIQDEIKQQIFFDASDTLTMPSVYDDRFRLPQRPVLSIASITLDGLAVDPAWWYLDGDEVVLKPAFGGFEYLWGAGRSRSWRGPQYTLIVVYAHGYDPIPSTVRNTCMEMAVRVWVNPGSVAREADGNTSVVYDNNRFSPSGMLMTDTEKETLNQQFGRHSGTVQLR